MPTFQSIGIHPELRPRLVSVSKFQSDEEHQPIETPQALLSRNPTSLCLIDKDTQRIKRLALSQIKQFRQDVALAMIAQSRPGKRARLVQEAIQQRSNNDEKALIDSEAERIDMFPGTSSAQSLVQFRSMGQQQRQHAPLSTGSAALDELLAAVPELQLQLDSNHPNNRVSGVPFGRVTEFSGPTACGKTQLCLRLAATSSTLVSNIYYLCSSGALASLSERLATLSSKLNPQYHLITMQKTQLLHVVDAHQLLMILYQIEATLTSQSDDYQQNQHSSCDTPAILLIIDSASGCLNGATTETMSTVARTLKRLARHYMAAVVITNGTTWDRVTNRTKPALGKIWRNAADIQVWLQTHSETLTGGTVMTQAILEYHESKKVTIQDVAEIQIIESSSK
jgi:RecA/RadA recombinase